jgi:hypothetical protein
LPPATCATVCCIETCRNGASQCGHLLMDSSRVVVGRVATPAYYREGSAKLSGQFHGKKFCRPGLITPDKTSYQPVSRVL